jgi:uncharacterized membrane protein YraQ (UPF0718 family)
MNYCSIEDAWGKDNKKIEPFGNKKKESTIKIIDMNKHTHGNCTDFIIHIRKCKTCYNKVKNQFKSKIIHYIQELIEENKDTIVLILMGISILLFFNLINNITK